MDTLKRWILGFDCILEMDNHGHVYRWRVTTKWQRVLLRACMWVKDGIV